MNGHLLASAIAAATGGSVHPLPCDPRWPSFGVAIAPSGCVVLVRDHGHLVTVSVGGRAWPVTPAEPLPPDLPAEAKRWASSHASTTTLVDAALALAPVLTRELKQPWVLSIPGGQPAPTEMWLHPSGDADRASVGIFSGSIHVGDAVVSTPPDRRLGAKWCGQVVQHVRAQLAAYERNVVLSEESKRVATDLSARLGASPTGAYTPTYAAAVAYVLEREGREVAHVQVRGGEVLVSAGLPDERGWHGTAAQAQSDLDALVRAIGAMAGLVTFDTLKYGARYRVLESFQGLTKGEVVEYGGPIDNHAPHSFMQSGKEVLIDEYALEKNAHRVLAAVTSEHS